MMTMMTSEFEIIPKDTSYSCILIWPLTFLLATSNHTVMITSTTTMMMMTMMMITSMTMVGNIVHAWSLTFGFSRLTNWYSTVLPQMTTMTSKINFEPIRNDILGNLYTNLSSFFLSLLATPNHPVTISGMMTMTTTTTTTTTTMMMMMTTSTRRECRGRHFYYAYPVEVIQVLGNYWHGYEPQISARIKIS